MYFFFLLVSYMQCVLVLGTGLAWTYRRWDKSLVVFLWVDPQLSLWGKRRECIYYIDSTANHSLLHLVTALVCPHCPNCVTCASVLIKVRIIRHNWLLLCLGTIAPDSPLLHWLSLNRECCLVQLHVCTHINTASGSAHQADPQMTNKHTDRRRNQSLD